MGVYRRPDSKYWWLRLETTNKRERTDILVGETVTQRRDSRQVASDLYHQRMNQLAARLYRLPSARPAIRFAQYADWYSEHKIATRAGANREQELLTELRRFFDNDLLAAIDQDRVSEYLTRRTKTAKETVAAVTANREVDLLKAMLRDACPKYLDVSPLKGMKRLRIVKPRRRYTTEAEFDRLLAVCEDAQDTAILVLGRDGLARLGDLLDLKHTDREDLAYWIGDPKNGEPYLMGLTDRAEQAANALADNGSIYLFPKFRRAEKERDWPGSVRQRLEYLCRKAKVPYGRAKHGVTFHWGTRRSGATDYVVKRKAPIKGIQEQGGWKTPSVLIGIYNEATLEDQLRAIGRKVKKTRQQRKHA